MKKKITFRKLCELVSEIDYVIDDSFPFSIAVKYHPGKEEECITEYDFGIGDFSDYLEYAFEAQYVVKWGKDEPIVIDLQEPDLMSYNGIVKMLKEKLQIEKDTEIYLWDDEDNFSGMRFEEFPAFCDGDYFFSRDVVKELKKWNSPTEEEEEIINAHSSPF